jgi:hypothetical protein
MVTPNHTLLVTIRRIFWLVFLTALATGRRPKEKLESHPVVQVGRKEACQ